MRVDYIEISAFFNGKQFFDRLNGFILIDLSAFYLKQSFYDILYHIECLLASVPSSGCTDQPTYDRYPLHQPHADESYKQGSP